MEKEWKDRLDRLEEAVKAEGYDALIVSDPSSINYYFNISFDPMERLWNLVIIPGKKPQLLANTLFVLPEKDEDYEVIWLTDSDELLDIYSRVKGFPNPDQEAKIGVDRLLTAERLLTLMGGYPKAKFEVASPLVDRQRSIKTDQEMEYMRRSSQINDRAMARLADEVLPYGYSEVEAAEKLKAIYLEEGADGISFEPIIAYGPNGADPHHENDDTKPKLGDSIICDIGCYYKGYASDMTRTFYYGEVSDEHREVYETVRVAQERGLNTVAAGVPYKDIDAACRDYITDKGYGKYFTHRTGHFIGLDVHEHGDVSSANANPVLARNCFSIEPGVYLPGDTGVRIEDVVVAHEDHGEPLNSYPKDLQIIPIKEA